MGIPRHQGFGRGGVLLDSYSILHVTSGSHAREDGAVVYPILGWVIVTLFVLAAVSASPLLDLTGFQ